MRPARTVASYLSLPRPPQVPPGPAIPGPEAFGPCFGQVVRVIDGETVEAEVRIWPTIRAVVSVRVAATEAPEVFRPACPRDRDLGREATQILAGDLPPGREIRRENGAIDPLPGGVAADVLRHNQQIFFPAKTHPLPHPGIFHGRSPGDPEIDRCEIRWRQKQLEKIR